MVVRRSKISYYFLLFYYLFCFLFFCFSCEKSHFPLEPLSAHYTTHDYKWEIDTLKVDEAWQIMMSDIWGTDENNVWVVGHSDVNKYQIWHWDGIDWTNVNPGVYGISPSYEEIFGFSENDIWVVGSGVYQVGIEPDPHYREFILHFNGTQWIRYSDIKAPICLSIWGASESELYFGCDSGVVLYKNGAHWEKQYVGNDAQIVNMWGFNSEQIFAIGYSWSTYQWYFFEKKQYGWKVNDSGIFKFGYFLWGLDLNHFYSVGERGLYEYKNGQWINTFYANSIYCIYGNQSNNIFMGGYKNKLYHFNGENWHNYEQFEEPNRYFVGIWCNSNSVFLIMGSFDYTYIVRGYPIRD